MRRTKSLVKQENVLPDLREDFNRVRKYEFFDSQNLQEGKDLLEATLHAVYNHEINQAVVQARELSLVVNYDRTLKAADLLKARGLDSKPFCFHLQEGTNRILKFTVQGKDFDWKVNPLAESYERIPAEFIRNLTFLRQQGIKIDGLAIATPAEHESIKEIAKDEFRKAGTGFLSVIAGFLILPLLPLLALAKDPILLIRIGPFYLEAGRWI